MNVRIKKFYILKVYALFVEFFVEFIVKPGYIPDNCVSSRVRSEEWEICVLTNCAAPLRLILRRLFRKYRLRISLAHPRDCHFAHVQ